MSKERCIRTSYNLFETPSQIFLTKLHASLLVDSDIDFHAVEQKLPLRIKEVAIPQLSKFNININQNLNCYCDVSKDSFTLFDKYAE